MKIVDAKVIVCCPGRNFVTLKIVTDDGVTGVGDATLNGRELAVASYLRDHLCPLLIGRDPRRIEDLWQYFYKGAYWRRGPVTMSAIAAVDMALWDIKGKHAGMPLYQLLGGASREHVMVYCHATGRDIAETLDAFEQHRAEGFKAIRAQCGVPGMKSVYGVAKGNAAYEPATKDWPDEQSWSTEKYLDFAPKLFAAVRAKFGFDIHLLHDVHHRLTPIEAARLGKSRRGLPAVLDRGPDAGREPGRVPPHPAAHGDPDRRRRGVQHALGLQAADRGAADRLHPHHRHPRRRDHPPAAHRRLRRDLPGADGLPRPLRPLPGVDGRRAALRPVGAQLRPPGVHGLSGAGAGGVPHAWTFHDGTMHPGEAPGHGVDIDEALAARYPYERAYLPVARLEDGTLWNW